jgi:hypothetical protein
MGTNHKCYKCYNPDTRKFHTTMDVTFLENERYFSNPSPSQGESEIYLDPNFLCSSNDLISGDRRAKSHPSLLSAKPNQTLFPSQPNSAESNQPSPSAEFNSRHLISEAQSLSSPVSEAHNQICEFNLDSIHVQDSITENATEQP